MEKSEWGILQRQRYETSALFNLLVVVPASQSTQVGV